MIDGLKLSPKFLLRFLKKNYFGLMVKIIEEVSLNW